VFVSPADTCKRSEGQKCIEHDSPILLEYDSGMSVESVALEHGRARDTDSCLRLNQADLPAPFSRPHPISFLVHTLPVVRAPC
jgi:hypothetical protein